MWRTPGGEEISRQELAELNAAPSVADRSVDLPHASGIMARPPVLLMSPRFQDSGYLAVAFALVLPFVQTHLARPMGSRPG